jgi:hypothetical protein
MQNIRSTARYLFLFLAASVATLFAACGGKTTASAPPGSCTSDGRTYYPSGSSWLCPGYGCVCSCNQGALETEGCGSTYNGTSGSTSSRTVIASSTTSYFGYGTTSTSCASFSCPEFCSLSVATPGSCPVCDCGPPCTWGGMQYPGGASWLKDSCFGTCTCIAGSASCSTDECVEGGTSIVDAAPDAIVWDGGPSDAGPAACFSDAGAAVPGLKACTSDADCTFFSHVTDCCGSIEQVGVNVSEAAAAMACEGAWVSTLPVCDCVWRSVTTEDGKNDVDGATPQVHCAAGASGSFCETSLP